MWAQVINAVVGIWVMASPGILGLENSAADVHHIFGPIVASFAIISCWEATRSVRLLNVPVGAWLIISPLVLDFGSTASMVNLIVSGAAITLLSLVKGTMKHRFDGGWAALFRSTSSDA